MKIGIISINAHTKVLNFASPLHSYAFQQFLDQNGIDNVIIDYKPCYYKEFDCRHPYDYYLTHPYKTPKKQEEALLKWKTRYEDREIRFDRLQEFIDSNYRTTEICYNQDLLDELDPGCDIYMCVTDVIWKHNNASGFDRGFFLSSKCMEGKGKIAYAASRGAKEYTEKQRKEFAKMIQSFDYISCREKSMKAVVDANWDKKASMVIDPVFLQGPEFYEPLCRKPEEQGYVLVYAVMEKVADKIIDTAVNFAAQRGLKVIDISDDSTIMYENQGEPRTIKYGIGIEEWLGYMKHADYIFTNSFHCCCFSILFNRQFFTGPRSGDKVDWVLHLYGLGGRRFIPGDDLPTDIIDYTEINKKREKYREASGRYVLDTIRDTEKRLKGETVKYGLFHKAPEGIDPLLPKTTPIDVRSRMVATALGGQAPKYCNLNTIKGMNASYEGGYRMMELDVRMTSDRKLACVNGWSKGTYASLKKEFPEDGPAEMTLEEFLGCKYHKKFQTLSFEGFAKAFAEAEYRDEVEIILDVGRPKTDDLDAFYDEMIRILKAYDLQPERFIIRLQRENDVKVFRKKEYPCRIFYYLPDIENARERDRTYKSIFRFCKGQNIDTVSMSKQAFTEDVAKLLEKKKLKSMVFSYTKAMDITGALQLGATYVGSHYINVNTMDKIINY